MNISHLYLDFLEIQLPNQLIRGLTRGTKLFQWMFTPPKTNVEPKNEDFVQMNLLFKGVIFRFRAVRFRGSKVK